jgi:hypothetical protein
MQWYEWLIFALLLVILAFIIVATYNAATGNPTIYVKFTEPFLGTLTGLIGSVIVTGGSDIYNCGAVGKFCDPSLGLTCVLGQCICAQTGTTFCPNYGCVDLQTFTVACGSCTASGCASNSKCCKGVCTNVNTIINCGSCGIQCTGVNPRCCAGICKDLNSDTQNCGACFNSTPLNSWCCSGTIQSVNDQNCTACGISCPTGMKCNVATRSCIPGCSTGFTLCNGVCVNLNGDNFNCTQCGTVCPQGTFCRGNGCISNSCQTGSFFTNGVCIPLNTNDNCGQVGLACPSFCGNSGYCSCATTLDCPAGYACNGQGLCIPPACAPGFVWCASAGPGGVGQCVQLSIGGLTNNVSNGRSCGACGVNCASGTCVNGKCACSSTSQCPVGYDCTGGLCVLH